jgi:hypothetical protein
MLPATTGNASSQTVQRNRLSPVADASPAPSGARFEPNLGQFDASVRYLARVGNGSLFVTSHGAVLSLPGVAGDPVAEASGQLRRDTATPPAVIRFAPEGVAAEFREEGRLPGHSNYFLGNDQSRWRTEVPASAAVRAVDIRPGVDLVYYSIDGGFEYDVVFAAGADPATFRMRVTGCEAMSITAQGDLALDTGTAQVILGAPRAYQLGEGGEHRVASRYTLHGDVVSFACGAYDTSRPLVIDPAIVFGTGLSGSGADFISQAAVGPDGEVIVAGFTTSFDFPTVNPLQPRTSTGRSAFVSKFDSSGTTLLYSTYLGGSGDDPCFHMAADSAGRVYLVGPTSSTNFPTTPNHLRDFNAGGYDVFISRISASGSMLEYSSYLGGSGFDNTQAIAVHPLHEGGVFITGMTNSVNFPTKFAQQPSPGGLADGFVTHIDTTLANAASLKWSTYYGGSFNDNGVGTTVDGGVAVDETGIVHVTGSTSSSNLPLLNAIQPSYGGNTDAFVAGYTDSGSLVYSTYYGGGATDTGFGIDSWSGVAYVAMGTASSDFPLANPVQPTMSGAYEAAVVVLDPLSSRGSCGQIVFSTYLGGSSLESAQRIRYDPASHSAVVCGNTDSSNFPLLEPVQGSYGGGVSDGFVAQYRFDGCGAELNYSTYIGGAGGDVTLALAYTTAGDVITAGAGDSSGFPSAKSGNSPRSEAFNGFVMLLAPGGQFAADLSWDEPVPGGVNAPQNLTADVVTTVAGVSPALPGASRGSATAVTGYKVYQGTSPNVPLTPGNLVATLPPTTRHIRRALRALGSYYVVTACYGETQSSGSNEAAAGTPGATVTTIKMKTDKNKITGKGSGFSSTVVVFVDGVPFSTQSTVKGSTKVVQKGPLATGQSLSQYLTSGRIVDVSYLNIGGGLTTVRVTAP